MKTYIIPALTVLSVIALLIIGPIQQNQDYHHFADQRKFFGVPNFLNVITNLPFFLVGYIALIKTRKIGDKQLKQIVFMMFTAFLLVAIGSGYYHWSPNNVTLVYDRLPIAIVIMSFFAFVIYESVDKGMGYSAFLLFNIYGVLSVLYWNRIGDLRWYGFVQFFPVLALPLILLLYKSALDTRKMLLLFIFFVLAKFAEMFDMQIYYLLDNVISGHSLKHLLMVGAEWQMIRMSLFSRTDVKSSQEIS